MPTHPQLALLDPSRLLKWGLLMLMFGVTLVTGQSTPPLVALSPEPLYMNGAKTKANLTLTMSVEAPTVGQAYRGLDKDKAEYVAADTYLGYFDPNYCYTHNIGQNAFEELAPAVNRRCNGGGFSGNFMNWATASAMDILRMGLTGGNRVVDAVGVTVLERAWLPDLFYRSKELFSARYISKADALGAIETSLYTAMPATGLWIYNCRNRLYFATAQDNTSRPTDPVTGRIYYPSDEGNCAAPFNTAPTVTHPYLIGPTAGVKWYEVRVRVCDNNTAANRVMSLNAVSKKWEGLCFRYGSNNWKPVGQLQMNAESMRLAVFGYSRDNVRARYGGVLRAPMKYLGPKNYDANFNLVATVNAEREWDEATGILRANPHVADPAYPDQGLGISGAINYINKFGALGPAAEWGIYKQFDPVSELYYESLRYLQGRQPTPNATTGLIGNTAAIRSLKDNFPVYTAWTNPFTGFVDSTGTTPSCLRNSIVTVADAYTHNDRSVPGNTIVPALPVGGGDFARAVDTNPTLDVPFWTSVVGSFESRTTSTAVVTYLDSLGRTQTAGNLPGFVPLDPSSGFPAYNNFSSPTTLETAASMDTGSNGGSHYLAGMAYWANTQSFHPVHPKARVKSFVIDVNENQSSSSDPVFRRTRALHLAAKYGGFNDKLTGQTGNPYSVGSNLLWQDVNGDAQTYFLASDPDKFLDSIAEVFARAVDETGSIAGGAISTQRVTAAAAGAVFQARFNPNGNFWSGRVIKSTVTLGTSSLVVNPVPAWEAGQVMTAATLVDQGAARKIVIGPAPGRQGIDPATSFSWSSLSAAHQAALGSTPANVTDTLGPLRVNYLRGDQTQELSASNPAGIFRPRDIVLGDIVNSGLVYMDRPNPKVVGSTNSANAGAGSYRSFVQNLATRQRVMFVNANDGKLHAFDDQTGREAFAYIPGFLAHNLNRLPERDYVHFSMADATPALADVFTNGAWRTALVSGVGGGAQGVFALDVSNPAAFTTTHALWEFTDRDHPAMGNVLGTPQVLKFKVEDFNAPGTYTYKTLAVVASGVNNYAPDGYAHNGGNPSIFLLDMAYLPSPGNPWAEGVNFWRIELPQTSTAMAKGLVGFNSLTEPDSNVVNALYAGDLQGNFWKLDFSRLGVNSTNLTGNATTNFQKFNRIKNDAPLFIATTSNGTTLQPLTGVPEVIHSFFGKKLLVFGTGKFLESGDTSVPLVVGASVYAVLDDPNAADTAAPFEQLIVNGRAALQQATVATNGTVTVPSFSLGTPPSAVPNVKSGWYMDLNAAVAERQVSDISVVNNRVYLATLFPTRGSCGEGGGRTYSLNSLTGAGYSEESTVGVLAAPLVMNMGAPTLPQPSGTTGRRVAIERIGVISQGAKGLVTSGMTDSYPYQTGRLGWRLLNNYQNNAAN